jgi:hypothetical protein
VKVPLDPAQLGAVRVDGTGPGAGQLLYPLVEPSRLQLLRTGGQQAEYCVRMATGDRRGNPAEEGDAEEDLQRPEDQGLPPGVDRYAEQREAARVQRPEHHPQYRAGYGRDRNHRDEELDDDDRWHQEQPQAPDERLVLEQGHHVTRLPWQSIRQRNGVRQLEVARRPVPLAVRQLDQPGRGTGDQPAQ